MGIIEEICIIFLIFSIYKNLKFYIGDTIFDPDEEAIRIMHTDDPVEEVRDSLRDLYTK